MSIPVKPCEGRFSDDLLELLSKNRNREQWGIHKCEVCGASVGAQQVHGRWVPEQHWPSVIYPPRSPVAKRYDRHSTVQHEEAVAAR